MGCAPSKLQRSDLLARCRRRRDLAAAAAATWTALGASHAAHLRALRRVANALHRFATDSLVVAPPASNVRSSLHEGSHLILSDSEGSHLHLSDDEGEIHARKTRSLRSTPGTSYVKPHFVLNRMRHAVPGMPSYVYRPPSSGFVAGSGSGGNGWEYWDPFTRYEQLPVDDKAGSVASSLSSRDVRIREGIPDLETETESEIVAEGNGERKASPLFRRASPLTVGGVARGRRLRAKEIVSSPEGFFSAISERGSDWENSDEESELKGSVGEEVFMEKRDVQFEVGSSCISERSGPSYGAALVMEGKRDVWDVVFEIKKQFDNMAECCKEVSMFLGVVDFDRHRWTGNIFAGSLSKMIHLLRPLNRSRLERRTGHWNSRDLMNAGTSGMSSSLEKLYLWEKKMYQEVKNAEKLHIMHEKKFKQQSDLRGSTESKKSYQLGSLISRKSQTQIAETLHASLTKLHVKIDISIKSVDYISGNIQTLRDKELQPRILELIQGLMEMWKHMLNCLQEQYKAIADCRTSNIMAKTSTNKNNVVAKASQELEKGIRNWSECFYAWSQAQKAYIAKLNEWLFSWIEVEPEITADGIAPFSPARAGAPAAVVICNDWYHATRKISEDRIVTTLVDFARNVHELHIIQQKEHQQRLRKESLSRDIDRSYGSMQKKANHLNTGSLDGTKTYDDVSALKSLRSKFLEEKAKYEETVDQMHKMAASILRVGLIPVFEELAMFIMKMLKAYEALRIPGLKGRPYKVSR